MLLNAALYAGISAQVNDKNPKALTVSLFPTGDDGVAEGGLESVNFLVRVGKTDTARKLADAIAANAPSE